MQITAGSISVPIQFKQQVPKLEQSDTVQTMSSKLMEKTTELSSSIQQTGITQKAIESAVELLNKSVDPVKTLMKILSNEQFAELNMDASPELKEAFDAFLNAINMDNTQILNQFKFNVEHQTKYSGDFFTQLNDLLTQLPDSRLKTFSSQLLRAYDCYLTMKNNETATQALLQNMVKQTLKIQTSIFEFLGKNLVLEDTSSENLPENVTTVLSHLAEQCTTKTMSKAHAGPVLTSLLEKQVPTNKIEAAIYKALSSSCLDECPPTTNLQNALTQLEKSLAQKPKSELQKLAQQILKETALPQKEALFTILKENLLPFLKENASASLLESTVYTAVEKLIQHETQKLIYPHAGVAEVPSSAEPKTNIYSLLAQRLIDNRGSYNLEIFKTEILPQLLQNKSPALEQGISLLTQSIMRVKDGQPENIWQAAENLFSSLEKDFNIDQEKILQLRFSLFENLKKSISNKNPLTDTFVQLLQTGIQKSASTAGKTTFEELLWALVLKNNVNLPTQYFFLPIHYGNAYMVSELWKTHKKQIELEEDEKGNQKEVVKDVYKLFLTFDIQNVGYFESSIFYNDRNFAIELSIPDSLGAYRETIRQNILSIVQNNHMTVGSMVFCDENSKKNTEKVIDSLT